RHHPDSRPGSFALRQLGFNLHLAIFESKFIFSVDTAGLVFCGIRFGTIWHAAQIEFSVLYFHRLPAFRTKSCPVGAAARCKSPFISVRLAAAGEFILPNQLPSV